MDINQYLEKNCGIHENHNMIEDEINQFQFYSLANYEILESIHIFEYSKIFNYYYIQNMLSINVYFKDFILFDYQDEIHRINQPFITNNLSYHENKYNEYDKLIKEKNNEIQKLSSNLFQDEINNLKDKKKEISTKLSNIKDQTFEIISLDDELNTIDKTIKIKLNKLKEIPNEVIMLNKEIDNLKKKLNKQLLSIKLFKHFPLNDYHIFINKQIHFFKEKDKNKLIQYTIMNIHYYFIVVLLLFYYYSLSILFHNIL